MESMSESTEDLFTRKQSSKTAGYKRENEFPKSADIRQGKEKTMGKYRRGRINDAVAQELAIALGNVREPKVINNFVSVTRAEVAPDLKYATIYFSCIGDSKESEAGLKKVTGMLRHHLATTLNLRVTPELHFVKDGSIEHGAHIARKLEEIKKQDEELRAKNQASED